MRRRFLCLALLFTSSCTPAARSGAGDGPAAEGPSPVTGMQAFPSSLEPLAASIRARLAPEPGTYGIAVIDLETGRSLGINDRVQMHAASTMKVPVLLELYRRAAAGSLSLDAPVEVVNRFRSIADSSYYTLSPADDSDAALYQSVGAAVPLGELARRMTARSSNLATNILIDRLGAPAIQAFTERVGGHGVRVLRGVEDGPAYRAGMNNTVTARGLAAVMAAAARCDEIPQPHCSELHDVLAAQEFNELIPAGLPAGTRVLHKTGWITGIQHDAAVVMPADSPPFVLVVLSRGAADTLAPHRVAADVARLAWQSLGPGGSLRPSWPAATAELLHLHAQHRVPAFPAPELRHDELWSVLQPIATRDGVVMEPLGESAEGRALRLLRWGDGPVRVLFWSQMHGDETTASRALADLFNYITTADDERIRTWRRELTILAVPMLNPDGAAAHRRRSAFGVDVNRDARLLSTPEGRALKSVQERWQPAYGFNLHDQNPRSRVGSTMHTAAISLLAPLPDEQGTATPGLLEARSMAAHLARAVGPLVGEHVTQYDDTYNPRAFGDGMQTWGVSTVLIETGSWQQDESKQFLRGVNFAALVTALDAIASGTHRAAASGDYTALPFNGRSLNDLLIRGGSVAYPGREPFRADISIDAAAVGGPSSTQVVDVGDLSFVAARDTLDATGLVIHPASGAVSGWLQPGIFPDLVIRRGATDTATLVFRVNGVRWMQVADR